MVILVNSLALLQPAPLYVHETPQYVTGLSSKKLQMASEQLTWIHNQPAVCLGTLGVFEEK